MREKHLIVPMYPDISVEPFNWDLFYSGHFQGFEDKMNSYDVILGAELLYYRTNVDALLFTCACLVSFDGCEQICYFAF